MEGPAPAAERRRVRARGLAARLGRAAEEAVRWRRLVRTERPVADRAADVAAGVAERDVLEIAANVGGRRHLQARAEEHRRHEPLAQDGIRSEERRVGKEWRYRCSRVK